MKIHFLTIIYTCVYNMNILIQIPTKKRGYVGDDASIHCLVHQLNIIGIDSPSIHLYQYEHELCHIVDQVKVAEYSFFVYIANDSLGRPNMDVENIKLFLDHNKTVFLIYCGLNGPGVFNANKYIGQFIDNENFYLFARDKFTYDKIQEKMTFKNRIHLTSDIVYSMGNISLNNNFNLNSAINWIQYLRKFNKKIVGLNIHYNYQEHNTEIIFNIVNLINKYINECAFILIPCDSRQSELQVNQRLLHTVEHRAKSSIKLIDYYPATDLKMLLKNCDLVISGRIHLNIISLSNGVPCVSLTANKNKVQRAMGHFDMGETILDASDSKLLEDTFKSVLDNYQHYKDTISQKLKNVRFFSDKPGKLIKIKMGI